MEPGSVDTPIAQPSPPRCDLHLPAQHIALHVSVQGPWRTPKRDQAIERADPTVDNIRTIAESVVAEARQPSEAKTARKADFNPPMMMSIF